jgi:very-short-patch-repair endonuclease
LRNNATEAERTLWWHLRGKQLGVKFRRQYSVDAFVVDFYAPGCKLAVEVDGDSHFTDHGLAHDRERTSCLAKFAIEVIRFTNAEIFEHIDAVVDKIGAAVQRRSQPPLAPPW